jgi:hypothetical protein
MTMDTSKRQFRKADPPRRPAYPELRSFDAGRRDFLARLGGALLGAGALGALLSACGGRAVGDEPEGEPTSTRDMGVAPRMDSRLDTRQPPVHELGGAAPPMDARLDVRPPSSDIPHGYDDDVPVMMDAQVDALAGPDAGPPKTDK